MKIKFIYGIIPVLVFFTKWFLLGRVGVSYRWFVLIHPRFKDDTALIAHELVHCKQSYRTLGLHNILYWVSKRWRYKSEVEAYKVQLTILGGSEYCRKLFARFIANSYKLGDLFMSVEARAYKDLG